MDQNLSLYIEDARLRDYAVSTARLLRVSGESGGRRAARRLRAALAEIRRCTEAVRQRYAALSDPPAACEWLLDNWYLARREGLEAVAALRPARRLRLCGEGLMILELCRALLRSGQGRVTERRCRSFLEGFQSITVLRRAELALIPACLRAVCLEELAAVCREMAYSAELDACAERLEALFGTLRLFAQLDTEKLLDDAELCGSILADDPGGIYSRMDRESRQRYLRRVEQLARRAGLEEHSFARRLIEQAEAEDRHVGFYLFSEPPSLYAALYIAANLLLTLLLSLGLGLSLDSGAAALLLLLPVSQLVKGSLDALLLRLLPPRRLPRLELSGGVPDEGRCLCVLALLLTDAESAHKAAGRLEELRFACRAEGENLRFGLLADLPEADAAHTEADAAILAAASESVESLNRRYGGGFYLFTRPRAFDGEHWSGRERKRGALLSLAALLDGRDSELRVEGDRAALAGTRFLLTLDSDTRLYPGDAGKLIGTMLHPLVRPRTDEERGVVAAGHGVLHPRLDTELQSANATDFALICAGPGGADAYGGLCGELYMDAFDRGGFAGKGLIDLRSLLLCSEKHMPEGRVLSHDAPEGALLRGGFVGDAAFSDRFPSRPLAYYKRLHRWVRGDWQNLPFLFSPAFAAIDRWRLFDSLRRSLLPPMTLLAILSGFLLPGQTLTVPALAALLALTGRILLALAESGLRQREKPRPRHYARLLTGLGGAILLGFVRLWLLPFESWICLSAALTALWRMLVSHRRLLQWQTAAQTERSGGGLPAHCCAMLPAALLGFALLLFSPVILGRSAGLLWLLSPAAAWALSLPAAKETPLGAADRKYLKQAAAESFRYYTRFCGAEDNFLPPDNVQEQPPLGAAHRTSPTNIGLCLLSFVAACDMELTPKREALGRIARMLDTLERMPRHAGHFFNWYDTRTLKPLPPALLSTVDSGNLCAALTALREALREYGEQALAERASALAEAMDFSPLYDRERGLFFISYDPESGRGLGGWYDLMASEAMLTSYLAVARGDVPGKHWRRLSRAQLQKDGYRGLASWAGTMFEYLMPALFLPLPRGSLLSESARFCLYAQRRQVFAGKPWGISESAFYSLDPSLSYRYKASGCDALALRHTPEADMVVAPYASFLALAVNAPAAVKNLRRLERFGARGPYGFYEALDFTPARCRRDEGERVACWMAHHVGMSILAAANALCGDSIRRRFLSDPAMGAYRLLLEERIPEGGAVLRRERSSAPERSPRRDDEGWQRCGGRAETAACLLSNGVWHLRVGSGGSLRARYGELTVYDAPTLTLDGCGLLPADGAALWSFSETQAAFEFRDGQDESILRFAAAPDAAGERWELSLRRAAQARTSLRLTLPLRLCAARDWEAQPAYWALGLESEMRDGALLLRRLPRNGRPGLWLCLICDRDAAFTFDAPVLAMETALALRPGAVETLRLAFCADDTAERALDGAQRILRGQERGNMVSAAALRLGMDAGEIGAAMALLDAPDAPLTGAAPRRALWPYGVSGELPLLCCRSDAREALPLLRRFLLLRSCGANCELVYLSGEQGEYRRPFYGQIRRELSGLGLEALLGERGGVHFAPLAAAPVMESRAVWTPGRPEPDAAPLNVPVLGAARGNASVPTFRQQDDIFCFDINNDLPPRCWQLPLYAEGLGAILSECGPAALWWENAREMRLVAPVADLRGTEAALPLWASTEQGPVSLFAANDGRLCRVRYGRGWAAYEKELAGRRVRTTVFAHGGALLLLTEGAEGLLLHWAIRPTLGPDASSLRVCAEGGVFSASNPESFLEGLTLHACCSEFGDLRTDFAPGALRLSFAAEEASVLACGCCPPEQLRAFCRPDAARSALARTREHWDALCARLRVSGCGPAVDCYVNHWAVYQTLCARLRARSSLYQSGGAYGFRDQLQDAVNLLPLSPVYARERILDACRHQYAEGDVMHWWHAHPAGDRGLRSRCADDLLWLPWALCEYADFTGDLSLCKEEAPYLVSPPLAEDERDRYETPPAGETATVLAHARAALSRCLRRGFGPNGLPLFGSGDWNDGFDAVDGESVWLGFFLCYVAERFAALLESLGEPGAAGCRELAAQMLAAAERAWNGKWYRRGYWADGSPLGGDARIDLLPQAWAAFCGAAHADEALDAALRLLVDEQRRLVRLFTPPFTEAERSPGYISGYGPGLRENGGQYTHGAVWLALALKERGRREEALRILRLLLPEGRDIARYEAEPFVLAADVSVAPGREGRAGWTWYTGSAGWYLRAALEMNNE